MVSVALGSPKSLNLTVNEPDSMIVSPTISPGPSAAPRRNQEPTWNKEDMRDGRWWKKGLKGAGEWAYLNGAKWEIFL